MIKTGPHLLKGITACCGSNRMKGPLMLCNGLRNIRTVGVHVQDTHLPGMMTKSMSSMGIAPMSTWSPMTER